MRQLPLNFIDIPVPETRLWEQLDDDHKTGRHRNAGASPGQSRPANRPQEQDQ